MPIFLIFFGQASFADSGDQTTSELATNVPKAESRCPADKEWSDEVVAEATKLTVEKLNLVKVSRSLTNQDICTISDQKLYRSIYRTEHPKSDSPGEWAKFRSQQQADSNGVVKPTGLIDALNARRAVLNKMQVLNIAQPIGIDGLWQPIGPGNIGGRIRSILTHPTDANILWVGTASGGIWKTINAGSSWSPVDDFISSLPVSSLVMSPSNSNIIYAGTGEGFFAADAIRGWGIFKSIDGGNTWNHLGSTDPRNNSSWYTINGLAIHPKDSNILLAASNANKIFRSTDGGASWNIVNSGIFGNPRSFNNVKFDPSNPNNVICSGTNGYVQFSTDAGVTWQNSDLTLQGRIEIAFSNYITRAGRILYASGDFENGTIYKSSNGGKNWVKISRPNHLGNQGGYNNTIWVDPLNHNHIVIGGLNLYRSTDGGVTFTAISEWGNANSVHADHHAIVHDIGYNGSSNKKVYFANDGGVYRTNDISNVTSVSGWIKLNNNLSITQFYSGAGHTGFNGRIIGGTQDNGSLYYSGQGSIWHTFKGGDGGMSAIDSNDGNYIYGEYIYLQLHRSTNGGLSEASYIYNGITDAGGPPSTKSNFIAPFTLDPNDGNTLYAGGQNLWKTTTAKDVNCCNWQNIKSNRAIISQIAVAKGNSNIVVIGDNTGEVYKSTNATSSNPSWSNISGSLPGARMLLSILIDQDNSNIIYVGYGGYTKNNLWKTIDGGVTWQDISTGLPQSPIRTITRHPGNASTIYVGTEVGVFSTSDNGTTWTTNNQGPTNVSVEQLFWLNSSTLVAATHGRGMYKVAVGGSSIPAVPPVLYKISSTTNSINVGWNGNRVATYYEVTKVGRGGIPEKVTTFSKEFSGLSPATSYGFVVRACNALGCSANSAQLNITTLP